MARKQRKQRKRLPLNVQRAKDTANARTVQLKKKVLQKLEDCLGVITTACKLSNCSRTQFYEWVRTDKEFEAAVKEIGEVALDVAESQLHKLMLNDNPAAVIFYLKTKGKHRGYIERQEFKINNKVGVDAEEDTYI